MNLVPAPTIDLIQSGYVIVTAAAYQYFYMSKIHSPKNVILCVFSIENLWILLVKPDTQFMLSKIQI